MVVNGYEFPRFVYDLLDGDAYSIGIHGIDSRRLSQLAGIPKDKVDVALTDIRENGLKIFSCRSINGTVSFIGRIDDIEDISNVSDRLRGYRYGDVNKYVLVAIPITVKDKNGNKIYLGKTDLKTENSYLLDTTGNERSCISDEIIPNENDVIPSEYILGTYSLLPDGKIDFEPNPKHVSKNGGVVSDEEFDRLKKNLFYATFRAGDISRLFTKDELTIEDTIQIENYIREIQPVLHEKRYLVPVFETLKQLYREDHIVKVKPENIDAINEKPEKINYGELYVGKYGEDLFNEQWRVIQSMQVEVFTQDGETYVHSDRDGEGEEFYRLLNDKEFVKGLFKYKSRWDAIGLIYDLILLTNDELLQDPEIYPSMFKSDNHAPDDYARRGILTREMLMDVAKRSSFSRETLFYLPKEYTDDLELILAFVDNANETNFGFVQGIGNSDFTFTNLSDEVRSNPELYERINKRALELNETKGTNFELLDVDKEVSLARGTHR